MTKFYDSKKIYLLHPVTYNFEIFFGRRFDSRVQLTRVLTSPLRVPITNRKRNLTPNLSLFFFHLFLQCLAKSGYSLMPDKLIASEVIPKETSFPISLDKWLSLGSGVLTRYPLLEKLSSQTFKTPRLSWKTGFFFFSTPFELDCHLWFVRDCQIINSSKSALSVRFLKPCSFRNLSTGRETKALIAELLLFESLGLRVSLTNELLVNNGQPTDQMKWRKIVPLWGLTLPFFPDSPEEQAFSFYFNK